MNPLMYLIVSVSFLVTFKISIKTQLKINVSLDEGGEASSVLSSVVSSTSGEQSKHETADFSEQNVPETSGEQDVIEIAEEELASGDGESKVKDDDAESDSNIKL